jgi:hypothetical protein
VTTMLVCVGFGLAIGMWPSRTRDPSGATGWCSSAAGGSARSSGSSGPVSPELSCGQGQASRLLAVLHPRWRAGRRDGVPAQEVADALVLIGLALRAGLPLTEALCQVKVEARGRVRTDLGAVIAALRWGRTAQEAWGFAGQRWGPAARATQMSEHTGAAAAALIEAAAAGLREEHERGRERAIARAGVLLVLPLGLGFLPAFACTAVVPIVLNLAMTVLGGGA